MLRQIDRDVMVVREHLLANPLDHGARGVLADMLDDAGFPDAAWRHRWIAFARRRPARRGARTRVQRWPCSWLQGKPGDVAWRAFPELLPAEVFVCLSGGVLANSRHRTRHARFYAGERSAMTALLMALRGVGTGGVDTLVVGDGTLFGGDGTLFGEGT